MASQEGFSKGESTYDKLIKSREAEGWIFVKTEVLTETRFQGEDAKFVEKPQQTEESIKEKHLQIIKAQDPSGNYEVDLILNTDTNKLRKLREMLSDDEYKKVLKNLKPEDKEYYVFVRKV